MARAGVYRRSGDYDMRFFRAGAGVSIFARRTWNYIEGRKSRNDGWTRTILLSAATGRFANCSFCGAAGGGAAVCEELLESSDARSRFPRKRDPSYLRGLETPGP